MSAVAAKSDNSWRSRLAAPVHGNRALPSGALHGSLAAAEGRMQVVVRLRQDSVDAPELAGAPGWTALPDEGSYRLHVRKVEAQQRDFLDRLPTLAPSARVIARTRLVLNAVVVEVDSGELHRLARDTAVLRIAPVGDYRLELSETVPHIGAIAVQDLGFDGAGVRVAVLDDGVDYTHASLGGPGTIDAYEAAVADETSGDGLFPTTKVVDGFDFTGPVWPAGPLAPDEDPIPTSTHGTHVADIIAGVQGVAPGASIVALKVCSSVSPSCSGVALLQAMEYAVDPNGDGDPRDAVDVINMSLGSDYGQPFDDDLSLAVDNATRLGVLTVAAAGNAGDRPFVVSTPSAASTALSVAQTAVPSAFIQFMRVDVPPEAQGDYVAVPFPWAPPLDRVVSGLVQYGDGGGGGLNGCDVGGPGGPSPFAPGSLTGLVVLVDRGACRFDEKVQNIDEAGGILGIVGLVAPGAPFAGGGNPLVAIPAFMIGQAEADVLRAGNAVVTFDPANRQSLAKSMVSTSARGPTSQGGLIKPEIGAPGASVSAIAGTGTATASFGGTSGATPMVSGAAALLLQAKPWLGPRSLKRLLVSTAATDITNPATGGPAPVSRIGGGEVRVDRAVRAPVEAVVLGGADTLGFGLVDVSGDVTLSRRVVLRNHSHRTVRYAVRPAFRFENDAATAAVSLRAPARVTVGPYGFAVLPVTLAIRGAALRDNVLDSGAAGNDNAALTLNEYDGYLELVAGDHALQLPWHVLPRKAARVLAARRTLDVDEGGDRVKLRNLGAGTAQNDAYALLALSDDLPEGERGTGQPTPDLRAVGARTQPVPAEFCAAEFLWSFALTTWERQTHLAPVRHLVELDVDGDAAADFGVFNADLSVFSSGSLNTLDDGRQVAAVLDYAAGTLSAFFFVEHATDTANTVLSVCGEQVGLGAADLGATAVGVGVFALDFYFGGPGDEVTGLTLVPGAERFTGFVADLGPGGAGVLEVADNGAPTSAADALGILLFTNGARTLSTGGATRATEALTFTLQR